MKLNQAVSQRLAELMQARAMTQYQLSTKSGVPKSSIGNIMHCAYDSVKLRVLHELCQGLSISLPEFFDSPLFCQENSWRLVVNGTHINVGILLENLRLPLSLFFCFSKRKDWEKKTSPEGFRFPSGPP